MLKLSGLNTRGKGYSLARTEKQILESINDNEGKSSNSGETARKYGKNESSVYQKLNMYTKLYSRKI